MEKFKSFITEAKEEKYRILVVSEKPDNICDYGIEWFWPSHYPKSYGWESLGKKYFGPEFEDHISNHNCATGS